MDEIYLQGMIFQQNGPTPYYANDSLKILGEKFLQVCNTKNGAVSWPPTSCNLTPLDYFLWGHSDLLVHSKKPRTALSVCT